MQKFTQLFLELDETNKLNEKTDALVNYFKDTPPKDAIWAISLLIGKRPKKPVKTNLLKSWAREFTGIPQWLFDESYSAVGDLSETIMLLTENNNVQSESEEINYGLHYWMHKILLLKDLNEEQQKEQVIYDWKILPKYSRFLYNKLIGGSFRVGVKQNLIVKALSRVTGFEEKMIAYRLTGNWQPTENAYHQIFAKEDYQFENSKPYPFYLAYPLEESELPEIQAYNNWLIEYKWDGIRSQIIKRNGEVFIWSRGEELVTHLYPELVTITHNLPDGAVFDGEILAWKNGGPLDFTILQKRIGRNNVSKNLLNEVPVIFMAFDLLEYNYQDIREIPLKKRRKTLNEIRENYKPGYQFFLSPEIISNSWNDLKEIKEKSRKRNAEGLMIKDLNSIYHTGRKKGEWWKWKAQPFVADAVLIYAQPGSGKRSGLYTDYTFGIWDNEKNLLPFAKAYSGLTDKEIKDVDKFIKQNTIEKFGPVRTVKPLKVFELAFENIHESNRHKSGVAVRFPRIKRQRPDKTAQEADNLDTIKQLIKSKERVD